MVLKFGETESRITQMSYKNEWLVPLQGFGSLTSEILHFLQVPRWCWCWWSRSTHSGSLWLCSKVWWVDWRKKLHLSNALSCWKEGYLSLWSSLCEREIPTSKWFPVNLQACFRTVFWISFEAAFHRWRGAKAIRCLIGDDCRIIAPVLGSQVCSVLPRLGLLKVISWLLRSWHLCGGVEPTCALFTQQVRWKTSPTLTSKDDNSFWHSQEFVSTDLLNHIRKLGVSSYTEQWEFPVALPEALFTFALISAVNSSYSCVHYTNNLKNLWAIWKKRAKWPIILPL